MMNNTANLCSGLAYQAKTCPQAPALFVDGTLHTYAEIAENTSRIASWILKHTGQTGPRVGILASRSLTAYVGLLGAAWAGAAYVPLNPAFPSSRLREMIKLARLDALVVDRSGLRHLPDLANDLPCAKLIPFPTQHPPDGCDSLDGVSPNSAPVPVPHEALAYIMFTSGTTGHPKGISVSTGNVFHLLASLQERYQIIPEDRLSQFFELSFDLSVFDIFMAFSNGASLYVIPEPQLTNPVPFIRDHALSIWFSVPSLVGALGQMNLLRPGLLPSLRLSLFFGEPLPTTSAHLWQEAATHSRLDNLYGPTEATVACMVEEFTETENTAERGIVAIGKPLPGLRTVVVDDNLRLLRPGETGELAVSGPQVALGYLDNPALTAARFPTWHHDDTGLCRWYLTGDLARQDDTGRFHFLGRVDNQVQIHGHRVELDEVEQHLREVSGLDTAVVIFIDSPDVTKRQFLGVVTDPNLNLQQLKRTMGQRIPGYMVPRRILCLDELPRNASGKIDRRAIGEAARQIIGLQNTGKAHS